MGSMDRWRVPTWTFDASAKTVTLSDMSVVQLEALVLIINVTDNIIIYDITDPAKGATVATNVFTLAHDTSVTGDNMDDADKLYIVYDSTQYDRWKASLNTYEYMTTGAQTNDDILLAVSSGVRVAVTGIDAVLSNDTSVDVQVRIGFGASAVPTEPTTGAAAVADVLLAHPGMAPGSGIIKQFNPPMYGNAGSELRVTNSVPTSGQLSIVTTFFTITD